MTAESTDGGLRAMWLRPVFDIATAVVGAAAILSTFVGGAVTAFRLSDAGVPVRRALGLIGAEQLAIIGVQELVLPAALSVALAVFVYVVLARVRIQASSTKDRVAVAVVTFLTVVSLSLAVSGSSIRAVSLDAAFVTVEDPDGLYRGLVAESREPIDPGFVTSPACRPRQQGRDLYVCYGWFIADRDGAIVLGVGDGLLWIPQGDVRRVNVTDGATLP